MKRKQKGSRHSHPTNTGNKDIVYLPNLQTFGNETTDEENPHVGKAVGTQKACFRESLTVSKREIYDKGTPKSILTMSLSHFSMQMVFTLQKSPKTIRDLASEFSLDTSSIRQFLKRLIRHGIVSRVWRAYELGSDREACYYSSDPDVIEFCKARKEAQS